MCVTPFVLGKQSLEVINQDAGADPCPQVKNQRHHSHESNLNLTQVSVTHRSAGIELVTVGGKTNIPIIIKRMLG